MYMRINGLKTILLFIVGIFTYKVIGDLYDLIKEIYGLQTLIIGLIIIIALMVVTGVASKKSLKKIMG